MLKTSALAIALAVAVGGVAAAQTVRPAVSPDRNGAVLIKHDDNEDDNGRGRKLGHYKHGRTGNAGTTTPGWYYYGPYPPPGYGSSQMPPYPYSYPYPPSYDYNYNWRGY